MPRRSTVCRRSVPSGNHVVMISFLSSKPISFPGISGSFYSTAGITALFRNQVAENCAACSIQDHPYQPLIEIMVFESGHCLILHHDTDLWAPATDGDFLLRSRNELAYRNRSPWR